MTISEYKALEGLTLSKHKYPASHWLNEGLVYIGMPEKIEFKSRNEKHYFVYYLCLFVAFDLKVYDRYRDHYQTLKTLLNIPKFEYGLTRVMIFPSRIYDHYQLTFDNHIFADCLDHFEQFILSSLRENNIDINWAQLKIDMLNDSDLQFGSFGFNFCEHLKLTIKMEEFTSTRDSVTLVFYQKENDTKYSFRIKDNEELTSLILKSVKKKRVKKSEFPRVEDAIFRIIEDYNRNTNREP